MKFSLILTGVAPGHVFVLATQVPGKHAPGVTAAVTRLLRPHKRKCHTVTFDNGKENDLPDYSVAGESPLGSCYRGGTF